MTHARLRGVREMRQVRLDYAARIVGGATPKTGEPSYWNGPISWATPKDLSSLDNSRLKSTARTITNEGLLSCSAEVLPVNSVLFSSRAPIGLTSINTVPVATNQGFKNLIPNSEISCSGYLYHWLRANRPYLESLGNGATFKEVSKGVVSRIEIPLPHKNGKPDLDEQKRIAAILDKADAIRRKRQQALRLTDDFLRSVFIDMFGDPVTNQKSWDVAPASEVVESFRYGSSTKCSETKSDENQLPVLRIPNVAAEQVNWGNLKYGEIMPSEMERLRLIPGDILFVRTNGNPDLIGRCAMFSGDREAIYASYLIRGRLPPESKIRPSFLHALLCTDRIRALMRKMATTSAGNYNINTKSLGSIPIIRPSLSLQDEFVHLKERVSNRLRRLDAFANEAEELFSALQQRAFRGEL